jgi:N-acetyl-anhydromuramyl-L-alanine amidase AmpD
VTLIRNVSNATLEQALAYAGPGKGQDFVREAYRLFPESGYSPEVVVAQWSLETGKGTSEHWKNRNNPAGIGVTDAGDMGYSWASPALAAQAQEVHLSAYVDGYNRGLRRYLGQDPRYLLVLGTDWAGTVEHIEDLTGKWATDPEYGSKIATRLEQLRNTVPSGGGTTPQPGTVVSPPPLVWVGTGNYSYRANGQLPRFLVHHITDDMNYDNVMSWFRNPASDASSHFVIKRDGSIMQFVSSLNYAWTNGDYYTNRCDPAGSRVARRDIPALNDAISQSLNKGWNLNGFCVSIEYIGTPSNPPTDAQYASGVAIGKYLLSTYPTMSPHRFGQLRHADINPVSRQYCPGPDFDLARIITALGGDPAKMN